MLDDSIDSHIRLFKSLYSLSKEFTEICDVSINALSSGAKLLFCGNGGSAADCQHLVGEFVGRFVVHDRLPLPAISLTADVVNLTSISNDFSFDLVFERQIRALGQPGDVLFCFSTSGGSVNIHLAAEAAKERGLTTVAFTGSSGVLLASKCDHAIVIPCAETARIQEAHLFLGHELCRNVDNAFSGGASNV